MSEDDRAQLDAGELEAMVDAMVAEIDAACARAGAVPQPSSAAVDTTGTADTPDTPANEPTAEDDGLDLAALTDIAHDTELAYTGGVAEGAADPAPEAGAEADDDDLANVALGGASPDEPTDHRRQAVAPPEPAVATTAEATGGTNGSDEVVAEEVARMLEEAASGLGVEVDEPTDAPATLATAKPGQGAGKPDDDSLDEDLAALTDAMLDFDADPEPAPAAGESAAPRADDEPESYLPRFDEEEEDDLGDDLAALTGVDDDMGVPGTSEPVTAGAAPEPDDTASVPGDGPPTDAQTNETSAATGATSRAETKPEPRAAARARVAAAAGVQVGKVALTRIEPAARRGAELASKPLASKPASLRQTIGWFGIYTAFLGVCVFVWAGFVRSAGAPETQVKPTEMTSAEDVPLSPEEASLAGVETGD